jgi:hypothetical protein
LEHTGWLFSPLLQRTGKAHDRNCSTFTIHSTPFKENNFTPVEPGGEYGADGQCADHDTVFVALNRKVGRYMDLGGLTEHYYFLQIVYEFYTLEKAIVW